MSWSGIIFLLGKSYESDVVITRVYAQVTDKNNQSQPFIRLTTTFNAFVDDLTNELRSLGKDLEVNILHKFFPGQ